MQRIVTRHLLDHRLGLGAKRRKHLRRKRPDVHTMLVNQCCKRLRIASGELGQHVVVGVANGSFQNHLQVPW